MNAAAIQRFIYLCSCTPLPPNAPDIAGLVFINAVLFGCGFMAMRGKK